jgi:hypothetical protein
MNIFKKIWKSIYGPEFYADLANKGTGFSVGYYVKFILLVSIITMIVVSAVFIPLSRVFLSDNSINTFVAMYPADLNLNVKDGILSTNVVEPYKIALPSIKALDKNLSKIENFAVVDTKVSTISLESFKQYNTMVLLTKDSVVVMKDGGLQIIPFTPVKEELNINRQTITKFSYSVAPVFRKLVWLTPIFVYVGSFIANLFMLVTFFIFALLTWLILVLLKKSGGYMHSYRVTIHAMTLGMIISAFIGLSWFIQILFMVIVILINFLKKDNTAPIVIPLEGTIS